MSNHSLPHDPVRHGRTHLSTAETARLLNRQSQTLRSWASKENGPIVPTRVHGRLHWAVTDICRVLNVDALPAV